ncbi:trypsin-like serine protease [Clostridium aestuarii]|uniref:Trypsin-like serine protease n=1 Tax=Clostridium aestuarii TaxID=338193 RepID=A0ABT4CW79_9CLOT|nr:trypsin-like serine protease [Clostridium aestuarii]MCY6483251.1 trypsin-like serine protease [Clostridium aestuarii]
MNYKIVGEIRNRKKDGKLMGTCFLINPTYVLTAGHVLKDLDDVKDLDIIFKFINTTSKSRDKVYINYDDIDLAVLRLDSEIKQNINYSEIYADVALEKGDVWETTGYPEDAKYDLTNKDNKYSYLDGTINREIENEKCDYELTINDQKLNTDWQGLSGAPLLIDNKIVGIISTEFISKRIKTKIKVVSIQKVVEFLAKNDKMDVLKVLSYRCKNLLNDRIDEFHKECEEKFFYFQYVMEDFSSDCLVLKQKYQIQDIGDLVDLFLRDYANELQDLILLEDNNLKIKRKQMKIVDEVTNELKEQLIKDNKISLVLLWIILEGKYKSPRLASTYSLINENLKQDIYICNTNDGIKLLIGYAEMQENILDSIKEVLNEIDKEKSAKNDQERIIIWDELAVSYLDTATKVQINKIKNDKLELEIILLNSYNSEIYNKIQYKRNGDNDALVKFIVKNELDKYNHDIVGLCSKFKWIKEIKIHWISLPIESLSDFNNMLL